jgi:hypothetical protein
MTNLRNKICLSRTVHERTCAPYNNNSTDAEPFGCVKRIAGKTFLYWNSVIDILNGKGHELYRITGVFAIDR